MDGAATTAADGARMSEEREAKAVFYAIDWLVAKNAQFCFLAPTVGLTFAFACLACGFGAIPGIVGGVALVIALSRGVGGLKDGIESFSLLKESKRRAEIQFGQCAEDASPRIASSVLKGLAKMGSATDLPAAIALASLVVWGNALASSQGSAQFMTVPVFLTMAATVAYCSLWLRVDWVEAKAAADGMVIVQA